MRVRITIEVDTEGPIRDVVGAGLAGMVDDRWKIVYLVAEAVIEQSPLIAIDRRGE